MTYTVSENQTFPLCAELTDGILERNISIPLQVQAGLLAGKSVPFCYYARIYHIGRWHCYTELYSLQKE